ncbi:unnamed protein product [Parajaminaea phylloscopi]
MASSCLPSQQSSYLRRVQRGVQSSGLCGKVHAVMDDLSSASSYASSTWVSWFLASKGNEYFCEVDEDYILDRFNLTGLNAEVQHYPQALDLVTDAIEEDLDQETRDHIEAQGRLLYGLVHARYIITTRGLQKMLEKYKRSDFGRCPRVLCYSQSLLPLGLSDLPFQKAVKLYCPRCEDIYSPKSSRHGTIDGAFFGSSFPHLLFMVFPNMLPSKSPMAQSQFLLPPPQSGPPTTMAQAFQQQQSITNDQPSPASAANEDVSGRGTAGARDEDASKDTEEPVGTGDRGQAQGASSSGTSALSQTQNPSQPATRSGSLASGPPIHRGVERYKPRIFGFPVHEVAVLHRWQEKIAEQQQHQAATATVGPPVGGKTPQ